VRRNGIAIVVALVAIVGVWIWRTAATRNDGRGLLRSDGVVQREIDCDPCSGILAWTGTWFLPRGGPYIFALDSPGEGLAQLEIDGQLVVAASHAAQPLKQRRVLPAGPHAVRVTFSGKGAMRLYWLPPGRRGDPEYVPPEALRPVPPAEAGPMPHDLAYRQDAFALSATLVILAALILFLLRVRRIDAIALALFAVAAAIRLWHLNAFGQTWDEDVYWSSGRNYLENLVHLDFRARMWRWNFEHPPVAKYILGLGALWHDGYGPARALVALFGAGTCATVYFIGKELYSQRVGIAAALLLAFLPPAVAHSQISGLEVPSTFFTTLAMLWMVRKRYLAAGVAGGLATACRFIAGLVFVAMAVAALIDRPRERRAWIELALSPLVGFVTLILVWPRLWIEGPFAGLRGSLVKLNVQHTPEWFFGTSILTPVPKSYFFVYFVACATPALLVGLALAWLARPRRSSAICLAFVLAPFVLMFSPVIQSGVRYILPALPPAAILAGAGIDAAARRFAPWAIAAAAIASFVSCLSVSPYYLDYYNFLFGGPRAALARHRFIFGWWGEGVAAAVNWTNAHAPPGAAVHYRLWPNHIVWLRDDFHIVPTPAEADYVLVNHFQYEHAPPGFDEVFREDVRKDAPLSAVYQRRRQ
jgi:4-amino-4-deoxy-L-arabinose transferase-like glycosyltransferase